MEFCVKLQQLRIKYGFTQEQLAEKVCVSRVAVAKWESGRGYPNLDSLKMLAKVFDLTIDQLLSSEELIDLVEVQSKNKRKILRTLLFGITDIMAALLFVVPMFANRFADRIDIVVLQNFTQVHSYIRIIYECIISLSAFYGIVELCLQNIQSKIKQIIELILTAAVSSILISFAALTNQPNICIFFFTLFLVKIAVTFRTEVL